MVDDVVSRGERKIVMELEKLREKPWMCNGSLLLVIDISSIQGIIVGALLYTMHSFYEHSIISPQDSFQAFRPYVVAASLSLERYFSIVRCCLTFSKPLPFLAQFEKTVKSPRRIF